MIDFMPVHPVTQDTAGIAATIRQQLRAAKAPVRDRALDILIAATVIEHDLILVTRNIRHFRNIQGLQILTTDRS